MTSTQTLKSIPADVAKSLGYPTNPKDGQSMTNSQNETYIYSESSKAWNIKSTLNPDEIELSDEPKPSYLESLIGQTVGFVVTIHEILPAIVLRVADEEIQQLDLEFTKYQEVLVSNRESGQNPYYKDIPKKEVSLKVRPDDPALDQNGKRRMPQFGKLTPGTWFDLSPYTFQIIAVKNATEESAQESLTLDPNPDYRQVYETVRELKKKFNRVEILFGRRKG